MSICNLAENPQISYLQQVSAFANHFHQSPDALGSERAHAYQVRLVAGRKLAASSICIAVSALRFLYRITLKRPWAPDDILILSQPFKMPVVLSPKGVMHSLASVDNRKHRASLTTAYAAGLRVSKAPHLKVADVQSQCMVLRVDQGKGNRDRYVMLSPRLLEELRLY